MIIGLGCDLMDVARIEKALERARFAERCFTPRERERISARGAQTAAGYFAAKEAVAKALGTGFTGFSLQDISIENDQLGKPACRLSGGALERLRALGGARVWVSISHAGGMAMAMAVAESEIPLEL